VAGVAAGVLAQVILVVALGAVPLAGWLDARGDRPLPLARRVDARLHALGDLALLRRLRKDRRAVLRADVVALAIERGRVVELEEPVLEQLLIAQHRWVEGHADRLGVPRLAVV